MKVMVPNAIIEGGEMGDIIRFFNWEKTLGPIGKWSSSLITTVNLILQSPVPMVMLWGKDGIMIYNDAYSEFAGARHPHLLGSKVEEGWPEVADFNRNVMKVGLAGKTLSYKDQTLTLFRNNVAEEVSMDLNYSPIIDENGNPGGVLAIVVETTQRIQAEMKKEIADEALKQEQQHLRDLFAYAPSFISVLKGPDHVFELANNKYMQLVGEERDIIGKSVLEAVPEVKDQGFIEILDEVYKSGIPYTASEVPINLNNNGKGELETFFINFIYQPIKNEAGKIDGIFVQGIDITDMVKSKKWAEDQNKVLEMITSGVKLGNTLNYLIECVEKRSSHGMKASILLIDNEGKRLMHGAAPSLPNSFNDKINGIAIGPETGSCGTAAYYKKTIVVTDIENDPLWADFKDLAISHNLRACWSTPIFSISDHSLLGTFALYYDEPHSPSQEDQEVVNFATRTSALVIDRNNTETNLREREEHFRIIADNMQNLAWIMNTDGYRTWYNKQWYNYTGLSEEESLGFGWKKAHRADNISKVEEAIYNGVMQDQMFQLTLPLRGKNFKYRRFLTRVYPIKDRDGKILRWIGTNTDIEEQENITEKLEVLVRERTAELMRSNEDLQQFAHVASHDLKEPIRKIITFLKIVESDFSPCMPAEGQEYLQRIHKSADRVKSMIEGILLYSSVNSYENAFEQVDLNQVLKDILIDLEVVITEKSANINSCELPHVDGIKVLLYQLFLNLIKNALKFSNQKSEIEITWKQVEKNNKMYAEIKIKDNGIGFNQEDAFRIFESFTRLHTKDKYEGSGLGLALCKRIVDRHNGFIYAESQKNKGAMFTVLLPYINRI